MAITIAGTTLTAPQKTQIDADTTALATQIVTYFGLNQGSSDFVKLPIDVEAVVKRLQLQYVTGVGASEPFGTLIINTATYGQSVIRINSQMSDIYRAHPDLYKDYKSIHRVALATLVGLYLAYTKSLTDGVTPTFTGAPKQFLFSDIMAFNAATCLVGMIPNDDPAISSARQTKLTLPSLEYWSVFAVTFAKKLLAPSGHLAVIKALNPVPTAPILNAIFGVPPFITLDP